MKTLLMLLTAILATSCSLVNLLDTSDRLDKKYGIVLDTERNRKWYIEGYEFLITREAAGKESSGISWEEGWIRIISSLRSGYQENPEFYVNFIINRRRELGLPELGL